MGAIDGVRLLLSGAEVAARRSEENVSKIPRLVEEHGGQTVFVNGLRIAAVEFEAAVAGIFSLYEARMQSPFPKGPFFNQLVVHLVNKDQHLLAAQVHHYYLAMNVLKHGLGFSYEELKKVPNLPFVMKQPEEFFSMRVIQLNRKAS